MTSVLFVEDELDMRLYISTILRAHGYNAVSARDGKEGLALAAAYRPDVILLDVMMPESGGVFMYGRLKADPALNAIPVCIITGVAEPSFRHFLKMTHVNPNEALPEPDAYLEKPFEPVDLVDILRRLAPGRVNGER
ncbi:MAG: response regulator [Desulfobacterales bacterium]